MAEPIELWQQTQIEQLSVGESWHGEWYSVHRYKDGWHFMWNTLSRGAGICRDLGRFFDEDHIWEMRNFMGGKWDRGVLIPCPPESEWKI